jgi:STAS domain
MINGVPVVTVLAQIDVTTAGQLCMALLRAAVCRQATVVADLTRTRFCDSAGLNVLDRLLRRAPVGRGATTDPEPGLPETCQRLSHIPCFTSACPVGPP